MTDTQALVERIEALLPKVSPSPWTDAPDEGGLGEIETPFHHQGVTGATVAIAYDVGERDREYFLAVQPANMRLLLSAIEALSDRVRRAEEVEDNRHEFALECGKAEIARMIEAHDAFDCPDHLTFAKAAGLIANSIVEKYGRAARQFLGGRDG